MNLLAISTSTPLHQVWLQTAHFAGGAAHNAGRGEPRALTAMIWRLLQQAELGLGDVDLYAVDVGPGSFTGLRQGLATVRALAWTQDRPVAAVGSLEALVAELRDQMGNTPGVDAVAVALPARVGVAFVAWSPAPGILQQALLAHADADAFFIRAAGLAVAVAGSALLQGPLRAALADRAGQVIDCTAAAAEVSLAHPLASRIAAIAAADPARAGPALHVMPAYLAASEAEVHGGFTVASAVLPAERR